MTVRSPFRAGSFYEATPEDCQRHAETLLAEAALPDDLPTPRYGGLVPHAGWTFSGRLAAMTLRALLGDQPPRTLVIFGADHTGATQADGKPAGQIWQGDAWQTPVGSVSVDEELAEALVEDDSAGALLRINPQAHAYEHSIEVHVPLVRLLAPETRILPISMPPHSVAVDAGRAIAEVIRDWPDGRVEFVGSTDLTHHGGHFGNPGGYGEDSEAYARKNDRRMLDLIERLAVEDIIPEAASHHNACGAGAIAAAVAAAQALGASRGELLEYTNSYEIMQRQYPGHRDDTTVGYASVVFV
jgi:AmmeMemoRadiSam system protein B